MGLRQLHTAETMFIDDGLTDGAVFPPSSNAVYDALQNVGGGGVEFITETYDDATSTYSLDKTYNEISAMVEDGKLPVIIYTGESQTTIIFVSAYSTETEDETTIYTVRDSLGNSFTADSADGTLTYIDDGGSQ